MIFRPFFDFDHGCAAYLFGCGGKGLCAVVDAREPELEDYLAFAGAKAMRITHVLDTHVHADHRSGGPALAERAGAEKLLTLADDLELYPAHFGGSACGAGLSGKPSSTVGFEKRWNRALTLGREEFVDTIAVVAAKPADSEAVLEFNRGGVV